MQRKVTKKEKRRLMLFVIFFAFIIIFPDWLKIMANNKEIALLEDNYEELLSTEESLKAEVEKLKNPEYLERYAKEQFLYTKPNEIIIRKTNTNE